MNRAFDPTQRLSLQRNAAQIRQAAPHSAVPGEVLAATALGNQAAQQFALHCPLRLPTPAACPFGGACHACPAQAQAKLKVSQPGDALEQEADHMAEQVLRMPKSYVSCPDEEKLHTRLLDTVSPELENHVRSLRSSGQPLPEVVRHFFEPRFGVNFSQIRISANPQASRAAMALNARAFTLGQDIFFGANQYAPDTTEGKRLLAHELIHVLDQAHLPPTIQRDKIDHRQLTWDDFKGRAPKSNKYWALTMSGLNPLDLQGLIPKDLEAQDSGEVCVVKKKKSGDIMGTTFRVDIGLDSAQIAVTPYMWQEKSWHLPWITDPYDRLKKCTTEFVKPCQRHFKKKLKQIDKTCKKHQKACQKAFKSGKTASWSIEFGSEKITATGAQQCTDVILEQCRTHMAGDLTYEASLSGATITANALEECNVEFQQECVGTLLEEASIKLLEHEQTHFDITNVRAQQIQNSLHALVEGFDIEATVCAQGTTTKAQKAGKAKAIAQAKKVLAKELKKLQAEYARGKKQLNTTQKQYELQTRHGVVQEMQQQWQENIAEGLP